MKSIHATAAALLWTASALAGQGAYVERTDTDIAIGNRFIELGFRTAEGRCAAVRLVNKLARRVVEQFAQPW